MSRSHWTKEAVPEGEMWTRATRGRRVVIPLRKSLGAGSRSLAMRARIFLADQKLSKWRYSCRNIVPIGLRHRATLPLLRRIPRDSTHRTRGGLSPRACGARNRLLDRDKPGGFRMRYTRTLSPRWRLEGRAPLRRTQCLVEPWPALGIPRSAARRAQARRFP